MMLEWTARSTSSATSQGNMGDSEPPDILYETCACVIHTSNLQLHVHNIIETLHDQSFSHDLKIASKTPNHQLLGTRGPRDRSHDVSVCAVSFTLIYM